MSYGDARTSDRLSAGLSRDAQPQNEDLTAFGDYSSCVMVSGDRFFRSLIAELFIGTIATCTPCLGVRWEGRREDTD
jgi:hypothetical protein